MCGEIGHFLKFESWHVSYGHKEQALSAAEKWRPAASQSTFSIHVLENTAKLWMAPAVNKRGSANQTEDTRTMNWSKNNYLCTQSSGSSLKLPCEGASRVPGHS